MHTFTHVCIKLSLSLGQQSPRFTIQLLEKYTHICYIFSKPYLGKLAASRTAAPPRASKMVDEDSLGIPNSLMPPFTGVATSTSLSDSSCSPIPPITSSMCCTILASISSHIGPQARGCSIRAHTSLSLSHFLSLSLWFSRRRETAIIVRGRRSGSLAGF